MKSNIMADATTIPIPERRRFETLDSLRFFAFLRVFFLHVGLASFPLIHQFTRGGENGVSFFFTLSGFLISYLLFQEKLSTGKVDLGAFMLRRVLRIWPLYFLMAGVAYATPWFLSTTGFYHAQSGYDPDWRFTFFFLENYRLIIENNHPNVAPLWVMWSLCVEEHYYILWGLLFTFVSVRKLPIVLSVMTILPYAFRYYYRLHGWDWIDLPTNLDYFAFGGLTAYLYIRYTDKIEAFAEKIPKALVVGFLTCTVAFVYLEWRVLQNGYISICRPTILSIVFSLVLLVLVPKKSKIKLSEKNPLSWLGTISYGLYLIHTVSNSFVKSIFIKNGVMLNVPINATIYIMTTLTVVILLSAASYYLFETRFLNLKKRFKKG
ncbi:MAG: acyltransferase [Fibrobacteres bacterium]|nr:acyltransferase [Fibrobacterota bacterium]